VLGTLCLVVLMGCVGLGVDLGVLRYDQRLLQTAADSAALGGASGLPYDQVTSGATNAAGLNGFAAGGDGDTLAINNPPLSGPHAGDAAYVEAIAGKSAPVYFLGLLHIGPQALTARAVAHLGNGPACFYALDPSASNAVLLNGSFNVAVRCGIVVDSDSSQALNANGSGSLSAASISVVGDARTNGSVSVSPTPQTSAVPVSDPLAYLTPPSSAGNCSSPTTINGSGNYTLSPGVYCSQLIINGSPTVTFQPGTYVLEHGMTMNGSPTVTGNGVTFYNAAGAVTFNGNSSSNLNAPSSGSYAGILVYQASGNSSTLTINGSASAQMNGAIYVPSGRIVDNGSGSVGSYSILVADTLTINGSAGLKDDYSSLPGGSPIKAAILVE